MNVPETLNLPVLTPDELLMERHVAAKMGHDTQQITEQGWYTNPKEQTVDIRALRDAATQGSVTYQPDETPPVGAPPHTYVHTFMHNQTTLAVAEARVAQGCRVAIFNFASATSPCGGWLGGARAQEESLARSSMLVHALRDDAMYADLSHRTNPFYEVTVIVTPRVPFFRYHNGQFLEKPWLADVITSAAVMAKAVRTYMPERVGEIAATMRQRAEMVFRIATTLDADILILGAWGCGAFGNNPEDIAQIMYDTMQIVDMRRFVAIDFAAADVREPLENYPAFAQWFEQGVFGGYGLSRVSEFVQARPSWHREAGYSPLCAHPPYHSLPTRHGIARHKVTSRCHLVLGRNYFPTFQQRNCCRNIVPSDTQFPSGGCVTQEN